MKAYVNSKEIMEAKWNSWISNWERISFHATVFVLTTYFFPRSLAMSSYIFQPGWLTAQDPSDKLSPATCDTVSLQVNVGPVQKTKTTTIGNPYPFHHITNDLWENMDAAHLSMQKKRSCVLLSHLSITPEGASRGNRCKSKKLNHPRVISWELSQKLATTEIPENKPTMQHLNEASSEPSKLQTVNGIPPCCWRVLFSVLCLDQ